MEIIYPTDLIALIKDKHLLLDTNVFRDATSHPTIFNTFFNNLKKNGVTLVTIDLVKYELLIGSANGAKYKEKSTFIDSIIDADISTITRTYELAYDLIKEYQLDGKGVSVTDLLLGAVLRQYRGHIYLLSRDTSAFIQRVYDLVSIVNCPISKGIFTYGIYRSR